MVALELVRAHSLGLTIKQRPITQHDIAAALGIGQKSVSRVFGAPGYVSNAMRARVLEAAERLGYRPNAGARAMRTGRFNSVVLVQSLNQILSWLPQELLHGIESELEHAGIALTAARFPEQRLEDESFLPRMLSDLAADGVLINYETNIPPLLSAHLARHRIPAVWINSKQTADCARPDETQAGQLLTEHLLDLGHRRIAYFDSCLAFTDERHYSRADRMAGYRAAMAARGLPDHVILPSTLVSLDQLWRFIPEHLGDATALITYDPQEAGAAILGLARTGRSVPEAVSVVTFSLAYGAWGGLPLTVAEIPIAEVGRAAVRLLRECLEHPGQHLPPVVVPFTLRLGASSAPPPATERQ